MPTLREYAEQLNLAIAYLADKNAKLPNGITTWMARLLNRKRSKRNSAAVFYDYA